MQVDTRVMTHCKQCSNVVPYPDGRYKCQLADCRREAVWLDEVDHRWVIENLFDTEGFIVTDADEQLPVDAP